MRISILFVVSLISLTGCCLTLGSNVGSRGVSDSSTALSSTINWLDSVTLVDLTFDEDHPHNFVRELDLQLYRLSRNSKSRRCYVAYTPEVAKHFSSLGKRKEGVEVELGGHMHFSNISASAAIRYFDEHFPEVDVIIRAQLILITKKNVLDIEQDNGASSF